MNSAIEIFGSYSYLIPFIGVLLKDEINRIVFDAKKRESENGEVFSSNFSEAEGEEHRIQERIRKADIWLPSLLQGLPNYINI